jgi:uncharacterized protein (DUF1015 family)
MYWLKPFSIQMPARDKAHLVASRSYMSYGPEELADKLERNPFSFLHVINPDGLHPIKAERGTRDYFAHVRKGFEQFYGDGWIESGASSAYAVYRQTTPSTTFTGLISLVHLGRATRGRVKTHEQTLKTREQLFAMYLDTVRYHAEPVLLARPDEGPGAQDVDAIVAQATEGEAALDFTTTDRVRHTVWEVEAKADGEMAKQLSALDALYVADGHHRLASSIRMADQYPDSPPCQEILAFIIPERDLCILGYHREVRELPGPPSAWLPTIAANPAVKSVMPYTSGHPLPRNSFAIHHHEGSTLVTLNDGPLERVDAGWIGQEVVRGVFGIRDPRNDHRMHYIPGNIIQDDLVKRVHGQPDRCVFELRPVTPKQLMHISDQGGVLPPKSTWIEPKLRSGLFIYPFA